MASGSSSQRQATTPDNSLVIGRPQMAKAELSDNGQPDPLSRVVMEAAKDAHEKDHAVAAMLGKDKGNYSRDGKAGRLTTGQLSQLGPTFFAALGKALTEEYGDLVDPMTHALLLCDRIDAAVKELRQFVLERKPQ